MTIGSLTEPDVIRVASRSRPNAFHVVAVSVLAGETTGCSCEAGQRGMRCWARDDVDATEGVQHFERCVVDGKLMRLRPMELKSDVAWGWFCPESDDHSAHEDATEVLYRWAAS